ncbi:uncharacterized protein LOC128200134 [Galleria mellonella]|uniref:Uncharacterized protein LOC128200134 n=1 Tax=Galleria mellonella TaxID=7137 RepID=A0ABM3MAJ3_GALME|nr:uncharacterized protein LOC128200134 [Galleria mellonella]
MFLNYIFLYYIFYLTESHTPNNNSDVIITYSGHAEANVESPRDMAKPKTITIEKNNLIPKSFLTTIDYTETDDVLFVPNEKKVHRIDEEFKDPNVMNIGDVVMKKTVGDVLGDKGINVETERPKDILFISGKNNENIEKSELRERDRRNNTRRSGKGTKPISLDCTDLDCNNTIKSLCGGKIEHKKWKYRLFLNECYFRKVNCNFKYAENRYTQVREEFCNNIAAHYSFKPYVYKFEEPVEKKEKTDISARRSYSSRRSQNKGIDGHFCSHACPISCPEDYNPECALSNTGLRKVFANHCKLDYNSCAYRLVWQRRPLAECVGGKKADLQQNRGFIGWMQRIGIVDNRGRLVLY